MAVNCRPHCALHNHKSSSWKSTVDFIEFRFRKLDYSAWIQSPVKVSCKVSHLGWRIRRCQALWISGRADAPICVCHFCRRQRIHFDQKMVEFIKLTQCYWLNVVANPIRIIQSLDSQLDSQTSNKRKLRGSFRQVTCWKAIAAGYFNLAIDFFCQQTWRLTTAG